MAETEAEAEKRQWKAGGRPVEQIIIFMKQIDKNRNGREFRETTETVQTSVTVYYPSVSVYYHSALVFR